jgi:hypothetical protein
MSATTMVLGLGCGAIAVLQVTSEPPWGLAGTAAGVAVLMVVLFLRAIATMQEKHTAEMKAQRELHVGEMREQRSLFVGAIDRLTKDYEASAERVEVALRDLASELRAEGRTLRGTG